MVKDPDVFKAIDKIKEHFSNNVNNRFVRKALLTMDIPQSTWDLIESLAVKSEFYKVQGYQFDELYDRILAAATFIFHARKEILPNITHMLRGGTETVLSKERHGGENEKVLVHMAINNFSVNLKIFSDLVNELYVKTVELDKEENIKTKPIFERIPELKNLGQYLVTE